MSSPLEKIRIDKWLWAVRIFKTRTIASAACEKGKVTIGDQHIKASRAIKAGDKLAVRQGAFRLQFEVLQLTENRMPAKLVSDFCKDITPQEEIEKIKMHSVESRAYGHRGEGRPTKKDRRELDEFTDF
jgi:ribosome-associated heat shock protein Hsp15